jgi:putative peptidoglycan lipid II flippase
MPIGSPPTSRPNENREIARTAGIVGALTLCSRITGLVRDSVVGYLFGSGLAADAFFVAFRIPNLLRRFVAEGAMNVAFIPVFTEYLTNRTRAEAVQVARVLATSMTLLLAIITVLGVIFAPLAVSLFAPGFAADPEKAALTIELTRLLFPYIFLVSVSALLGGLLNSLRHFVAPAFSPVLLNLSMIAAAWFLAPMLGVPVYAMAIGVLFGGVLQVLIQIPPLQQRGIVLKPDWQPRHVAVRRVLLLMAPTVFGAAVYQVNVMMDTVFASVLPEGSVSFLWYADRVFEFPLGLFPVALGTAALPSFAAQAARRAYGEMRHSVTFAVGLTNLITIPSAVGFWLLSVPIVAVLFQRGAFGPEQVQMTAWALSAFSVGLWSVSIVRVFVPAFYAMHDTRTPVVTAAASFVANLLFSLMFIGLVHSDGSSRIVDAIAAATTVMSTWDLRHAGLALSTSLASGVNLALLAIVLSRRLGGLDVATMFLSFVRSSVASAAMILPVRYIAARVDWLSTGHLTFKILMLGCAVGAGVATFALAAFILGGPEIDAAKRIVRRRIKRP